MVEKFPTSGGSTDAPSLTPPAFNVFESVSEDEIRKIINDFPAKLYSSYWTVYHIPYTFAIHDQDGKLFPPSAKALFLMHSKKLLLSFL